MKPKPTPPDEFIAATNRCREELQTLVRSWKGRPAIAAGAALSHRLASLVVNIANEEPQLVPLLIELVETPVKFLNETMNKTISLSHPPDDVPRH